MSTFLYKRAGAAAKAAGSWWADWTSDGAHAAWGGNGAPGKIDHANLLEPRSGNARTRSVSANTAANAGREESRRCTAETTE